MDFKRLQALFFPIDKFSFSVNIFSMEKPRMRDYASQEEWAIANEKWEKEQPNYVPFEEEEVNQLLDAYGFPAIADAIIKNFEKRAEGHKEMREHLEEIVGHLKAAKRVL